MNSTNALHDDAIKSTNGGRPCRQPETPVPATTVRGQLQALIRELGVPRTSLLLLAIASAAAGAIEAALLAVVVQAATSMASHESNAVHLGPLSLQNLSVSFLLAAGFGLTVARLGLQVVRSWVPARLCANAQAAIQKRVLGAFLRAKWAAQAAQNEGHLQELVTNHAGLLLWAVRFAGDTISTAFVLTTLIIFAVLVSPVAAITLVTTAAILFTVLRPLAHRARQLAVDQSTASLALAQAVSETVRIADAVQTYAVEEPTRRRLDLLVDALSQPAFWAHFLWQFVPGAYQTLAIVFVLAGLGVLNGLGTSNLASLGAVMLILMRSLSYGQSLQSASHQLSETWANVDLVLQTERELSQEARPPSRQSLPLIKSLAFDKVSYAYDEGRPVLRNLSFEVEPGEAIGIAGPSGAGKSTVVQVLLRLRTPTAGRYLVNGSEAEEFARSDWFARIAYLPQDPQLIAGTVSENIAFFRPGIDQQAIELAARAAGVHEEICGWAAGYDTIIGQRANAVSGGQRQRLCLARALASCPELLILDEPTGALDHRSEALVRQALERLKGRVTLIVVAHRSSILDLCDRMISLDVSRVMGLDEIVSVGEQHGFRP